MFLFDLQSERMSRINRIMPNIMKFKSKIKGSFAK